MPHWKRAKRARKFFKVDSLLETIINRDRPAPLGDYMTLMFLGYMDKSITDKCYVELKTYLLKNAINQIEQRTTTEHVKIIQS